MWVKLRDDFKTGANTDIFVNTDTGNKIISVFHSARGAMAIILQVGPTTQTTLATALAGDGQHAEIEQFLTALTEGFRRANDLCEIKPK